MYGGRGGGSFVRDLVGAVSRSQGSYGTCGGSRSSSSRLSEKRTDTGGASETRGGRLVTPPSSVKTRPLRTWGAMPRPLPQQSVRRCS